MAQHAPQHLLAALGALRTLIVVRGATETLQSLQIVPLLVDLISGQYVACTDDEYCQVETSRKKKRPRA